jgi:hypothetical protein
MLKLIGGSNFDFATFRNADIPGVEFAYFRGSPIYHTPVDTPERVSLCSLQQQGANPLDLTRQLGDLEFGRSIADTNAVFFNIGRFNVVRYLLTWELPIALMTGAVLVAAG